MANTSPAAPATGHAKQYVFVDEYNRHKRLKVMRACDQCRKRKIRCDGALQNGPWPCGACVRLRLKCVPPTLDPDEEQQSMDGAHGQHQFFFQNASGDPSHSQQAADWSTSTSAEPTSSPVRSQEINSTAPTSTSSFVTHQQLPGPRLELGYTGDAPFDLHHSAAAFQHRQQSQQSHLAHPMPSLVRTQTEASGSSSGDPQEVDATMKELSEHMGDLRIDLSSAANWVVNEKKTLSETPAMEEPEFLLPLSINNDSTVAIPPEMMPSEERAMDYFGYFFNYIHPYVPILNRSAFYEQWRSARQSISPLILEGIFACVARYLEDPIEVRRWLALAARHEESFKDVPRLSTIQGYV